MDVKQVEGMMDYRAARQYLGSLPEAQEDWPFGPDALVLKVHGRMFALLYEQQGVARVNLKCDPAEAQMLRDIFPAVLPGYHMNKKHWNTVVLDGSVPVGEIQRMMENSWRLVVEKLPRKARDGVILRATTKGTST